MSYVNMEKILKDARKGGYAVGAFNIVNQMTAKAAVEAAEELSCPIILQTSVKTVRQFGIEEMMQFLKPTVENAKVDVAVHLDHSTDVDLPSPVLTADGAPLCTMAQSCRCQKIRANTKKIVEAAHAKDVTVEGELGAIVGVEDDIVVDEDQSALANPEDCKVYLEETKIDAFAPAIGTAHGVYKGG